MAQFLRPDSIISQGNWTGGFANIDEVTPNDGDRAYSQNNPNGSILEVGLSNPAATPGAGTVTFRYRAAKVNNGTLDGTGTAVTLDVILVQGTTTIATEAQQTLTGAYVLHELALTQGQRDAITDWNNLRLRFTASGGGGSPTNRRGAGVSWAEVEAPDGSIPIAGSANNTFGVLSLTSAATIADVVSNGTATNTLGTLTSTAIGSSVATASANNTFGVLSLTAIGSIPDLAENFDPSLSDTDLTFSNSDLTITNAPGTGQNTAVSETQRSTGKYYFELDVVTTGSLTPSHKVGLISSSVNVTGNYEIGSAGSVGYRSFEGNIVLDGVTQSTYTAWNSANAAYTIAFAVDLDAGLFWVRHNGTWLGDPSNGTGGIDISSLTLPLRVGVGLFNNSGGNAATVTGRFTNNDLVGSLPSGFSAWDGTVGDTISNGTLNKTLGILTSTSSGFLGAITGEATNSLGLLTSASASSLLIQGISSSELSTVTVSSSGLLNVKGTSVNTLIDTTVSSLGFLPIVGSATNTLSTSVVSVGILPLKSALITSLDSVELISTAKTVIIGSFNKTLGILNSNSLGSVVISGFSTNNLGSLTIDSSGTSQQFANGSFNATTNPLSVVSTGLLKIEASAEINLSGTVSSTAVIIIDSNSSINLSGVALDATSTINISAMSTNTLVGSTLESIAGLVIEGTSSNSLQSLTLISSGTSLSGANLTQTLGGVSLGSIGNSLLSGTANLSLSEVTLESSSYIVLEGIVGSANVTLGSLSSESSANTPIDSDSSPSLGGVDLTSSGRITIIGVASVTLTDCSVTGIGQETLNPFITPPDRIISLADNLSNVAIPNPMGSRVAIPNQQPSKTATPPILLSRSANVAIPNPMGSRVAIPNQQPSKTATPPILLSRSAKASRTA